MGFAAACVDALHTDAVVHLVEVVVYVNNLVSAFVSEVPAIGEGVGDNGHVLCQLLAYFGSEDDGLNVALDVRVELVEEVGFLDFIAVNIGSGNGECDVSVAIILIVVANGIDFRCSRYGCNVFDDGISKLTCVQCDCSGIVNICYFHKRGRVNHPIAIEGKGVLCTNAREGFKIVLSTGNQKAGNI